MAEEKPRELTLYVQSKKVVTSFYRPSQSRMTAGTGGPVAAPSGVAQFEAGRSGDEGAGSGEEHFFLSDDQARALAMAEELAGKRGFKIDVVDVAKAGRIERLVAERLRGVQNFPVMIDPTGRRLEGVDQFTEEHLCEMMPTEMRSLRAFTYLKVRGGDLDRIRLALLGFSEVRELHLLTGDWDVFVVLEFSGPATRKRQVLDFVTERIRGIPEVLDTSTLVPEFSVTKFPVG
ncbi:MAG: Lrp/AsnC family transcriptional regulator [Solirubrobacterales bacterium]|nr:Lrp/AsnC ligand binding domain-containing protein [Thermoplasmata archaeon]